MRQDDVPGPRIFKSAVNEDYSLSATLVPLLMRKRAVSLDGRSVDRLFAMPVAVFGVVNISGRERHVVESNN